MSLKNNNIHPVTVGKYRVSPLSLQLDDGRFRASVSIRSGTGSAATDRVLRFVPSFHSDGAARRFAREQGLAWVANLLPLPAVHRHADCALN